MVTHYGKGLRNEEKSETEDVQLSKQTKNKKCTLCKTNVFLDLRNMYNSSLFFYSKLQIEISYLPTYCKYFEHYFITRKRLKVNA